MKSKEKPPFDSKAFLAKAGEGRTSAVYRKKEPVFAQGDPADSIFYIQKGQLKITVVSHRGKKPVIGILGTGDFFGEGCLARQPLRMASAAAMLSPSVMRVANHEVNRVLRDEPAFSELFLARLISRHIRSEEHLVDQLFNSSEKRLARVLLLPANFGKEGEPREPVIPNVNQERLAEIVGRAAGLMLGRPKRSKECHC